MPLRTILRYPDPGLKTIASPVTIFDDKLALFADDLLETMRHAPGVGITACHVGVFERIVVMELKPGEPRIYVNPVIEAFSDETMTATEGSVSMPGVTDEIERPRGIRLHWQDLEGKRHEGVMTGFEAVCMQHEIDQLDGVFWLQRLSRLKRERLVKKFQKAGR